MPNSGEVERDPRISPEKGDVLRHRNNGRRRYVIYVERNPSMVQCIEGAYINSKREKRPTLRAFRRWAKDAEVIHVAS